MKALGTVSDTRERIEAHAPADLEWRQGSDKAFSSCLGAGVYFYLEVPACLLCLQGRASPRRLIRRRRPLVADRELWPGRAGAEAARLI